MRRVSEGAHQVQLPRRLVRAVLAVRHAQHIREMHLHLDEEAMVDEVDVHVAVAARRRVVAEPIFYAHYFYVLQGAQRVDNFV